MARAALVDGFCLQAEDEIAALVAVVGPPGAGPRPLTATSGPGFCS
jgi:pyruvate/2-oxoacid:ferredoxin oxidoreductase alpha subunit